MAQKPRRIPITSSVTSKRPTQPMLPSKEADQFPGVGMTLPSYQYKGGQRNRKQFDPPKKTGFFNRLKQKITLKRSIIAVIVLLVLIGGFVGGKFLWNAHKVFGGNILNVLKTTKLDGEDKGRVNILLAGNSSDDVGHQGANLTDSIMVMSLDTKSNKAFLLSIPRDLWVNVGDYGHSKINEAYVTGEDNGFSQSGFPSGGMGQLEQVVSESLGLELHYYALINYNALKEGVDAVGGIDFTVASKDKRGLYDPNIDWTTKGPLVKLTNGNHRLSGQQALNLARARGDAYNSYGFAASDFDRTENQRKLMVALKTKIASAGVLSNPAKLTSLSDAVGNNVKTDFEIDEVRRFFELIKQVDNSKIQSLSLNEADGKNLLDSYVSPQGQSALAPAEGVDDFSEIQAFVARKSSSDPVVQEGAKVVVLNGTAVNGLAGKTKTKLTSKKLIVDDIGDAGISTQTTTSIIDATAANAKKPGTSAALVKIFGNNLTTTNNYINQYPEADFIIVVGSDQAQSTTTSSTE